MGVVTTGISFAALLFTEVSRIVIRFLGFPPHYRVAHRNKSLLPLGFSDSMIIKDREHLGRVTPRAWRN
jgi:hypothetical protein